MFFKLLLSFLVTIYELVILLSCFKLAVCELAIEDDEPLPKEIEINKAPVADIYFPAWKPILAQRKPSYNVSYEEIPVPVQAVSGGRLTLPCDVTSPLADDAVSLVLWYRDDSAVPVYSVDARRSPLGQARHAADDNLVGRAHFSAVPQPAVLVIDNVSRKDEGIYRCRVDFKKARTQHSVLSVTVVVPPGVPIIKDYNGKVLSGIIGPYNEGDSLHLICQAEGGQPPPSVLWWRSRRIIDDSYELSGRGVTRNEFFIDKLQRRDLMSTLTCQASNNNISPPVEASVTLDINFRPLSVHVKGKRKKLSAKKTVQFECEAKGSRPSAVISWRKGSYKLKNAETAVSAMGNVTTSTLTMTPSSEDNGKFLYCQADNPVIPGSSIEEGWKLDVHYVPQLNLRLGGLVRPSAIIEGTDVNLECDVRSNPRVSETGWMRDGQPLTSNHQQLIGNQSLLLQKVNREHRGSYSCTATNTEGQGESNQLFLRVQYSPVCKSGQETSFSAVVNKPIHIGCEVESDPDDVTFKWEFNGTSPGGNQQVSPVKGSDVKSILNYTPLTELDFGAFYCWGKNSVGIQKEPCVFVINPAEPPTELTNCAILYQTDTALGVACNYTENEEMKYEFLMVIHSGSDFINVSSDVPEFEVSGLRPDYAYEIALFAVNDAGKSKPLWMDVRTYPSPDRENRKDEGWNPDEDFIIFLVGAAAGGISIVALIIGITLKLRRNRRTSKESLSGPSNEKSAPNSEKSADSCSEGCTCSTREEEKIKENIPDVVVFSEKVKSEDTERMKSYSPKSGYWRTPIASLPTDPSPQTKMKAIESTPPWSTADWVIPSQPVEMVTLQFQRRESEERQPLSAEVTTSSFSTHHTTAKQTDV